MPRLYKCDHPNVKIATMPQRDPHLFKNKYRIKSARLPPWDYATPWWYYVTISVRGKVCWFGEINNQEIKLSEIGEIVSEEWKKTEQIRKNVTLDEWIVMPNHLHGIIIIEPTNVETPRRGVSTKWKPHTLGSIINQFKSKCTKRIWTVGYKNFAWQPRFYDHIIRNERSLYMIRRYIRYNYLKWDEDEENPNLPKPRNILNRNQNKEQQQEG